MIYSPSVYDFRHMFRRLKYIHMKTHAQNDMRDMGRQHVVSSKKIGQLVSAPSHWKQLVYWTLEILD